MISRIRIEAFGPSARVIEDVLIDATLKFEEALGTDIMRGECVIERQMDEPENTNFSFKGRLILHPDIGGSVIVPGTSGNSGSSEVHMQVTSPMPTFLT